MDKTEDSGTPRWAASLDVAKAFFTAASTAAAQSQRPSVVFSSSDDNTGSQLQKLQRQVTRVLKGFSSPPEVKGAYNPEVLTSQKRQWSRFQLQSLEQKPVKEPSEVFESMVIVGLHPNSNVQELQKFVLERSNDDSKRMRSFLNSQHQVHAVPDIEPEVLFVYPPAKKLPIKHRDLLSFCFPGGLEVHSIERTPSLSELNEILLGQEQLKQSNHSFVFRLQVADDSTLYGCCVLVEEIIQKPSKLASLSVAEKHFPSKLSRYIMTTSRCYCILSRLPFFDLHFGIIRSIFIQERFELLTKGIDMLNLLSQEDIHEEEISNHITSSTLLETICIEDATNLTGPFNENLKGTPKNDLDNESYVDIQLHEEQNSVNEHLSDLQDQVSENGAQSETNKVGENFGTSSQLGHDDSGNGIIVNTASGNHFSDQNFGNKQRRDLQDVVSQNNSQFETKQLGGDSEASIQHGSVDSVNGIPGKKASENQVSDFVLSLLRSGVYDSSKSSSFEVSPCGDESFRSDIGGDSEEPSSSGRRDSDHNGSILQWAKENGHGSLQIVCRYYELHCPARGSTVIFQPLEHLHQIEFCRPAETVLHIAGSGFDLRSHGSSLEVAEAHNALLAEEEATALSVWTVAALCGCLRLEHMMTMFAGALLEKQIVVVCSNLGMLSASVLSIIPLIRPYRWQSLLMPVLPNDMLEFLDAPVPYIVGIKNKTADIQSKLANVILVDANKNQVKSPSMPLLPQQKELFSSLAPYHAKLVGESYLARKRPVHECTDVQIEAAKGFLAVIRCYLDSFCSNLRSHTITNVQSNNDKVSLLLKESFIDSFPHRDQPFMKLFVDTQLFSVHTDVVLSLYQKD